VPLFLRKDQAFIPAVELKSGLHDLDEHYSRLPEAVKETGIMRFAQEPPAEGEFLVTALWDRFLPRWRNRKPIGLSRETEQKLLERLRQLTDTNPDTSSKPISTQEANHVLIRRQVPERKGKWRVVPSDSGKQQ
jgi:hypothetical protein